MRGECIEAVAQALGRQPTQQQVKGIEDRIRGAMTQLAREDRAKWQQMSQADRMSAAAELASQQLIGEANKGKQRVALKITAVDRTLTQYNRAVAEGRKPFRAVAEVLQQADSYIKGVSREYFSSILDTMQAVEPRLLGFMHDAQTMRDLVTEIYGKDSGNAMAKKGAKAWLETVENMRQRFNRAGGDVGKLDYAYVPQPHDNIKVIKAGMNKWITDTLPKLDRSRYVKEDGSTFTDGDMVEMLRSAWNTISTEGLNKFEPGKPKGSGMRANRHGESRQIHFKGPDEYLDYMTEYGKGTMLDAMQGLVGGLSRDIGLVEQFGPNPETTFRLLHDTATKAGDTDMVGLFVRTENMWHVLSGKSGQAVHARFAQIAQGVRNVEVFGKLQGAMLSSITDIPSIIISSRFNKLPVFKTMATIIKSFGSEATEYANRGGLVADSIMSDMQRWGEGNIGAGITGKLANATMKASLMTAWTDALRRGFTLSHQAALGKLTRTAWGALDEGDRARLERQGITSQDWSVWRQAKTEEWGGQQMLTVEGIRAIDGIAARDADRAASKLLGFLTEESEYAVVGQDLMTRAAIGGGLQRGTIKGEFFKSMMLFKGFPIAMIHRHWMRAADQWTHGDGLAPRVEYGAALMVGLTAFGAVAMTLKDMAAGKDPRDMTEAKFWGAAFAQGGGGSIFGDILYTGLSGQSRSGRENFFNLFGPVIGSAADLGDLATRGDGDDALRFARGHTPFVNLWYIRTALDRAFFDNINEMLSPGYKARMIQRARKDWGQDYFWKPGTDAPQRMPDLSATVGQ